MIDARSMSAIGLFSKSGESGCTTNFSGKGAPSISRRFSGDKIYSVNDGVFSLGNIECGCPLGDGVDSSFKSRRTTAFGAFIPAFIRYFNY